MGAIVGVVSPDVEEIQRASTIVAERIGREPISRWRSSTGPSRSASTDALLIAGGVGGALHDLAGGVAAASDGWPDGFGAGDEPLATRLGAGDGGFAMIAWNPARRTLVLARDQFGARPLYWARTARGLVAGSRFTDVLALWDGAREVDPHALDHYLAWLCIPAPMTLLSGVFQVRPGAALEFSLALHGFAAPTVVTAPAPECTPLLERDVEVHARTARDLLQAAMGRALSGCRDPVFFLSGGIDSATLLGCAAKRGAGPLRTVTLGLAEATSLDERAAARRTAGYFGTRHAEIVLDASVLDHLSSVAELAGGTPPGNPASLMAFALMAQLNGDAGHVVAGDGGNEVFGGVVRYQQIFSGSAGASGTRTALWRLGRTVWERTREGPAAALVARVAIWFVNASASSRARRAPAMDARAVAEAYADSQIVWTEPERRSVLSREHARRLEGARAESFIESLFGADLPGLQQMSRARVLSFLPYNAIPYMERNASPHGIVPLFPYLDRGLLAFLLRVPCELVFGRGYRYLMEKAFSGHIVPREVFRRNLGGFYPPIDRWLRSRRGAALLEEHLCASAVRARGLLDPEAVSGLIGRFCSGGDERRPVEARPRADGRHVWMLLALEAWLRVMDGVPVRGRGGL